MTPSGSIAVRLSLLLAGAIALLPLQASADDEVHRMLKKMVEAVHGLTYEGTFVYLHDNQLESMRVVHTLKEDGERERLISLNGAAREVVRDNASVTCIAPDARSVSVGKRILGRSFRAVFSMDTSQLADIYDFQILGQDRVANRPAKVVAIFPRDQYRYGYRVYLDEEYGLPLKTDMLDAAGEAVSQVMFTHLNISPDIEDRAETTLEGKELYRWEQRNPTQKRMPVEKSEWVFNDLPPGFSLSIHTRRNSGKEGGGFDHYAFTDGLASLSVYIEKSGKQSGLNGSSRMGAVNAYGSLFQDHQVTAVGEVPVDTVKRVAGSVSRITK
ncbi:MAG: MucB/RseB C-terminal domain-containing protein [Sedimenticola sp.]